MSTVVTFKVTRPTANVGVLMETATKPDKTTATATAAPTNDAAVKRRPIDTQVIISQATAKPVVTTRCWPTVATDATTAAVTPTANVMVVEQQDSTTVPATMRCTVEREELPVMAPTTVQLASTDVTAAATVNVLATAAMIKRENTTVRVTNNMCVQPSR